jgi:hypothetical protein
MWHQHNSTLKWSGNRPFFYCTLFRHVTPIKLELRDEKIGVEIKTKSGLVGFNGKPTARIPIIKERLQYE